MPVPEILGTSTEVFAALVGFAGVVVAFGRSSLPRQARQFRIKALLTASSVGLGASNLPSILVNFEIPPVVVEAVLGEAARRGVPSVLDAGPPRTYGVETWRRATVVSPNHAETEALLGRPLRTEKQLRAAAHEILSQGPEVVVVKRGGQGCLVVTRGEECALPARPVEVVDTTGAGDAFTAAFTVALAEGKGVFDAAQVGITAGALAVTRFGTMPAMPTRAEVDTALRDD